MPARNFIRGMKCTASNSIKSNSYQYFGEKIHRSACNNKCDNCQRLLGKSKRSPAHNAPQSHKNTQLQTERSTETMQEEEFPEDAEEWLEEQEALEAEEGLGPPKKLSPLQRLKARRLQRKAMHESHLQPPELIGLPVHGMAFNKVSKARKKKLTQIANLKAKITAKKSIKAKTDENGKPKRPAKLNKTGKINKNTDDTNEDNIQRTPVTNIAAKKAKKLNKTGKINKTGRIKSEEDDSSVSAGKINVRERINQLQQKQLGRLIKPTGQSSLSNTVRDEVFPAPFQISITNSTIPYREMFVYQLANSNACATKL